MKTDERPIRAQQVLQLNSSLLYSIPRTLKTAKPGQSVSQIPKVDIPNGACACVTCARNWQRDAAILFRSDALHLSTAIICQNRKKTQTTRLWKMKKINKRASHSRVRMITSSTTFTDYFSRYCWANRDTSCDWDVLESECIIWLKLASAFE